MSPLKKVIFIAVGILIVVLLGIMFYVSFLKKTSNEGFEIFTESPGGLSASDEERIVEENKKKLTAEEILSSPNSGRNFEKVFYWLYAGKTYAISQMFSNLTYEFYLAKPKEYTYISAIPSGKHEEYFSQFVLEDEEGVFSQITNNIISKGMADRLSDDQIAELAIAFVQSIKFNDQKALDLKAKSTNVFTSYPYETLYEAKGVAFDKSFLLYSILKKLGYGTALFSYGNANHMAVGIQCQAAYDNYDSGYCYVETTNSLIPMGLIPDLTAYSGKATIPSTESTQSVKLGSVGIFQKSQGKSYQKIPTASVLSPQVSPEKQKIETSLEKRQKKLEKLEEEIKDLEEDINKEISTADIIGECKDLIDDAESVDLEDDAAMDAFISKAISEGCGSDSIDEMQEKAEKMQEWEEKMEEYKNETIKYYDLFGDAFLMQ